MHKRMIFVGVLGVLGLGAITLYLLQRDGNENATRPTTVVDIFSEPGRGSGQHTPQEMAQNKGDSFKGKTVLQAFREWSRFPPDSRPISNEHRDIIDFDRVATVPVRLVGEGPDGKISGKSPYGCMLQPERSAFPEGADIRVFLSCGKRLGRARLNVIGYRLVRRVFEKSTVVPAAAASMNDGGENGDAQADDQIYTFAYKPQRADWGDMVLSVEFEFAEEREAGTKRKYSIETSFFSSPTAPAKFTGNVSEAIRNGSLILEVELNVRHAGQYEVHGNLRSASEFLAVAVYSGHLEAGLRKVPLRYYGLIFHEKDADGPYFLEGLRAFRNNDPVSADILKGPPDKVSAVLTKLEKSGYSEPLREIVPPYMKRYATRDYPRSAFTKAEWDSAYRRQRTKELMSMDL